MQTYFITANDTGSGKTYVAGILARHFVGQGKSVQMVKAIDCGDSGDATWVQQFVNSPHVTAHTLSRYPKPLAPLASQNCKRDRSDFANLLKSLEWLPSVDVRIIEGAGGLAVPIDPSGLDWRDFAEALAPDRIVVVVDNRLGAINQSRLVHAYLGQLPHAFVLNEIKPVDCAVKSSNLEAYQTFQYKLLGQLKPDSESFIELDESLLFKKSEADSPLQKKPLQQRLQARKEKQIFRRIKVPNFQGNTLHLSDNDYLDLRHNPDLAEVAKTAIETYGTSSSASPLVTGYTTVHAELESTVSQWYGNAPALIWNSGYAANQSVLKLFLSPGDIVMADRFIHNSLISGILASGARLVRFQHNDPDHLESLLKKHCNRKVHVVSESVYSMDGDYLDLKHLASLKSEYGFQWFLDEAHAIGWYGETGSGMAEATGIIDQVDLLTGTLGKALASCGAYTIFREAWMRDLCINEASEFIYSTYLPPSSAAVANAAIGKVQAAGKERMVWQKKARLLRQQLRKQGWDVPGEDSPVIPIICGESDLALRLADECLKSGLKVAAIRPPTVPQGAARLRLSLKSTLTEADCQRILNCFEQNKVSHHV